MIKMSFQVPTASEAWVQVIGEEQGYAGLDAALLRRLIERTKKNYALFTALRRHIPVRGKALEAGCGWACCSFALADQGISVTALDISEKLITTLKRMKQEMGEAIRSHLELITGDLFKLSELGERFDLIFNDGTYEHFLSLKDRQTILANMRDQLKPEGKYVVAVPNLANPFFCWVVDRKMPAMQRFGLRSLAGELEASGFRVLEQGYLFVNAGFEQWLKARWMAGPVWAVNGMFEAFPGFLKKILAAHIYCVAQKIEA